MKKLFFLIILIPCLLLCACETNSNVDFTESGKEEISYYPSFSSGSSIDYDTFAKLKKALSSKNEDKLLSYFLNERVAGEQVKNVQIMLNTIRLHGNIVPYIDGKAIELRNEDGFSNITLFSSEKYGLPCIFYSPKVSNGDNLYITVTCIPDEILQEQESSTASDLIKIIAPGYPNIDNFGTRCSNVYNEVIKLSDREVDAMVYEYNNDNRNSTFFIYDHILVEVRNDPDIWGMQWFSTLSFGSL